MSLIEPALIADINPQLKREYDRILPNLKDMVEKENAYKKRFSESNRSLGLTQAFEFGERSNTQYVS
jgi:nucleoporin NUP82